MALLKKHGLPTNPRGSSPQYGVTTSSAASRSSLDSGDWGI